MAKKKKKVVRKKATKKKIVKVGKGQIPVLYTTTGGKRYKYNKQRDKDIPNALPPGKRVTNWGTTYYEKRVNRSDAKGSLTGEKHYDTNSHNYNFTISGLKTQTINELKKTIDLIDKLDKFLISERKRLKSNYYGTYDKNKIRRDIRWATQKLNFYKKQAKELKRKI